MLVGFKCGAISKMPDSANLCPLWTVRSRKAIEDVDKLEVYLILGWSEVSK